jgi:hypothetical protein
MASVPCPHKDKGICTIPSRTAVIHDGQVLFRTRDEVEAEFGELDLRGELVPVARAREVVGMTAGEGADEGVLDDEVLRDALERADFDVANVTSGVIVYCSCGHTFMKPT